MELSLLAIRNNGCLRYFHIGFSFQPKWQCYKPVNKKGKNEKPWLRQLGEGFSLLSDGLIVHIEKQMHWAERKPTVKCYGSLEKLLQLLPPPTSGNLTQILQKCNGTSDLWKGFSVHQVRSLSKFTLELLKSRLYSNKSEQVQIKNSWKGSTIT